MKTTERIVKDLIEKHLRVHIDDINQTLVHDLGADSLDTLEIELELKNKFKITFLSQDSLTDISIQDIAILISSKINR